MTGPLNSKNNFKGKNLEKGRRCSRDSQVLLTRY